MPQQTGILIRSRLVNSTIALLLLFSIASSALAVIHDLPFGEPYELEGKRIAFTTWYMIRPGQYDWQNDEGKSVYADRKTMAKASDPGTHWVEFDVPHGIRIVAEKAVKSEIVIKPEHPWEKDGIEIQMLRQFGDTIRAWGVCKPGGVCYFESKDGVTWTRPKMNLVDFQGSKENNLVPGFMRGFCYDPDAPEAERYKAASNGDYDPKAFEEYKKKHPYSRMAVESEPGRVFAVYGFVSPDGHRWTQLPEPLVVETSDGGQYVYYDKKLRQYIMYFRSYMIGPRAKDGEFDRERWHGFAHRRAIGRSATSDFRSFPPSDLVIDTSIHMPPTDTFYFCCYTTIPRAPDHHLMFPSRYIQAEDAGAVDLYTSYDGKSWDVVPGSPVIDTGEYGKWDGGCVWAPNDGLVEFGDGSWVIPFRGDLLPHKYPRGYYAEKWGAAVWPKGRMIALQAPGVGNFTTMAFMPPGKQLRINALTERTGNILVEAADFYGKPIPGRTFADAIQLTGDQFNTLVRWKNAEDLGMEPGKPVVLRFKMNNAKIYWLDFK